MSRNLVQARSRYSAADGSTSMPSLSDADLQRLISGIVAAIMQSKPLQWIVSQMPPDWTPGSGEPEDVMLARNPAEAKKFSRLAREHAVRNNSDRRNSHMSFAEALRQVTSQPKRSTASVTPRNPAEAERFSKQARERAMRSIKAGKHMSFNEALDAVMSGR